MARINKIRFAGWLLLVFTVFFVSGCASYKAQKAYDEGEQYTAEENFDAAVEKYFEAANLDPSSKKYKLELLSARSKAAANHVKVARQFAENGKVEEALARYSLAQGLDPGLAVAAQEAKLLHNIIDAQKLAEEGAGFYAKRNLILARKAVNQALSLDANNSRALAIKDLLERDKDTVEMDGIELDVASEEPITLSFKDANIKEVFGILSQLSGINFIFDEEIRSQSISVLLEKASFAQAMELIMQMNGLGKKVLNSKTIIIFPQSREKAKQYEDQLIQTFYLSHIDAKKAVNLLRTMLQLRKVYVHEERNALVVRDRPEVIRLAEQILNAADRENSEVVFDLEIVSVSDGDTLNLGPALSTYSASVGLAKDGATELVSDVLVKQIGSTDPTEVGAGRLVTNFNNLNALFTLPSATFNFAKTLDKTEILANPKIRVRNKEKAKVHIGTREPVITVTQNGDNFSDSVQYVDVGVKLDVEPTIQLNNTVETKVKLEVSQKLAEGTTERGTKYLTISTTNAETVLTLEDGVQTIIGGLFEHQEGSSRKTIPLLGDIPLIGALFTNFDENEGKREILLSITPHIIRNLEVPDVDVATIWSGGEDNLKDGPNFGAFAQPLLSEIEATKPLAAPAVKPVAIEMESPIKEAPAQASEAAVPSEDKAQPEKTITPPVAEPAPVPAEAVPTEVIDKQEEIGPPIVLEMPKKGPAVITFQGPAQVEQGKEFSVAVQVSEIEGLYSAPLFVNYDPAALELVSINEGDFLKQNGETTVFSTSPNRTTGRVIVGYKQGTSGKGATGSGTLFNLVLKPIATGETRLEVNRVNFRNTEGVRLQVVPEAVMIEVR